MLPRDLRTDLAIGGETVSVAQHIVEHGVQFQLSWSVFMVALNNVQAHRLRIFNDLHKYRAQLFKLVNVITVRFGDASVRLSVFSAF